MSELRDKLDVCGWGSPSDPDFPYDVLKWMREATREIERLTKEVESLTRVLNSRTEHLA
jgi:hypothetical protein